MYCIIDNKNKTYIINEFQVVINAVFKWYVKDSLLYYKVRDYEMEVYDISIHESLSDKLQTLIINYLWNQLDRFNFTRLRVIDDY